MTTRWWAPTESDADWLAMLAPGQDPEKDLGLYLLAAHRAGAQQLTHVAKSSLASESSLVDGLATVRPVLSDAMVDAIGPITGPVYAALLVRDVLDEADQGALDVYRAAVSKGVPPPVALERAAAGYGMPTKEMGAFAAMAADPKANPRAVEDAADRSLMGYVAKVASQEAVSQVSKAEPARQRAGTVAETDFDEAEHPRGPDGRFVETEVEAAPMSALQRIRQKLGLTSTEPTRVADTTKAPTLTPSKTKGVELRQARAKRALAARQRQAAKAPALQQTPLARKTQPQTKPLQRKVSRTKLNRLTEQLNLAFKGKTEPASTELTLLPDLLHRLPDPGGDYYDIGQPVILGTNLLSGAGIRVQAATQAMTQKDPTRRMFRIGYLEQKAKYVEQQGRAQTFAHDQLAEAEITGTPTEYAHPVVRTMKHHELTNPREDKLHAERLMDNMVTRDLEMPSGDTRPVVDYDERHYVQALPVYEPLHVPVYDDNAVEQHDHEDAVALIHWQPADPRKPEDRPIPVVEEFVILTDARGYEEGSGDHVDIHLDPNQIYEVTASPNARPGARIDPEQMYDLDNQVVVNRWYLRPIDDEDIEKALTQAEVEVFNRLHPRDAEGQFAPTETETVTTTKPGVALRQARAQRSKAAAKVKASRTLTPKTATPVLGRSLTRAPLKAKPAQQRVLQRHPITAALEAKIQARPRTPSLPPLPVLTDARAYKVFQERDFQRLTVGMDLDQFMDLHRGEPVTLDYGVRRAFAETSDMRVEHIPMAMALNVGEQLADQMVPRDVLDEILIGARLDFEHIADRLNTVLERHPDYDLYELASDDLDKKVIVYGSKVSGSYQNIIEFEHELDVTGPLQLSYLGEYRAQDVMTRGEDSLRSLVSDLAELDLDHTGAVPNPKIHYYRLASPPVRRFRMDND